MSDKVVSDKQHLKEKVRESEDAVQTDVSCRLEDAIEHQKKFNYLKTFRDENKKVSNSLIAKINFLTMTSNQFM